MAISDLITEDLPKYVGASAVYDFNKTFIQKLTLESNFGDEYRLYKRVGTDIHVPRRLAPLHNDKRTVGSLVKIKHNFVPRTDEQARVVSTSVDLLQQGHSFVLRAGTGFGKTFCSLAIAAEIGRPTLVVVPKEDLFFQWINEIEKCWGIPKSQIGRVRQNQCDFKGKRIVVAMAQSITKEHKYPKALYSHFGLMIVDEAHRIGAETFSEVCYLVDAKLRLGLSATPKRKDGKDSLLYSHIGPIMVETDQITLSPKVLRFNSPWRCPRVKRKNKLTGETEIVRVPHQAGRTMTIFKGMARHKERNKMIVDFIKKSYNKKRDIIIFSDLIEHLETLRNMSMQAGVPAHDTCLYISGLKKDEREAMKLIRVRFTTWGMMSEGTDIPWADTAILASPRSNVEQAVGRILREHPDKGQPIVFDILDNDSPVFSSYASTRMAFYRKKQGEVKTMA